MATKRESAQKIVYLLPFNCGLAQGLLAHRALVPAIFSPEFTLDHQPFVQEDEQDITDQVHPNSRELNLITRELNLNLVDRKLNRVEENEDGQVSGNSGKYLNKCIMVRPVERVKQEERSSLHW